MRKNFIIAVLSCLTLSVSAQSKMDIELPAIKTVEASGNIVLRLIQGDKNTLNGTMEDNVSKDFSWQVKEGDILSLKLNKPTFTSKNDAKNIVLYLTFTDIKNIVAINGSSIINSDTLRVPYLKLDADGQGNIALDVETKAIIATCSNKAKIALTGTTDLLNAKARYTSTITAEKMISKVANVESIISAEIYVNASDVLTTVALTNGSIYYKKTTPVIVPLSGNQNNIVAY
ncbi:MAG: DUF2807 domain-containing protein [Rikenellaceae bacterium]